MILSQLRIGARSTTYAALWTLCLVSSLQRPSWHFLWSHYISNIASHQYSSFFLFFLPCWMLWKSGDLENHMIYIELERGRWSNKSMAPPGPRLSFHAHSGQHQIITSVHSDHEVVEVVEVQQKLLLLQLPQHDHLAYLGYHICPLICWCLESWRRGRELWPAALGQWVVHTALVTSNVWTRGWLWWEMAQSGRHFMAR